MIRTDAVYIDNSSHKEEEVDRAALELLETVKRIKVPTKISLRKLVVQDGSIALMCPRCNAIWTINFHEQEWVYENETRCRNCLREHRLLSAEECPPMPVMIVTTLARRE